MSEEYWRAKIWGLLHEPILKALQDNTGSGEKSFYEQLEVMKQWAKPDKILDADCIASASDRAVIATVADSIHYAPDKNPNQGLEISHLLSGAKHQLKIKLHTELIQSQRQEYLKNKEKLLLEALPKHLVTGDVKDDLAKIKELYWWLWRCLPEATCNIFSDHSLMLMPSETTLPDASIWSHVSIRSALAGALAGYDLNPDLNPEKDPHPYLAVFSFSPVQELIKSSRKMRDFWAGSWLLHYLSAKVCWQLANQYGPDTLLYPSLYQQPLIDHWLLQKYSGFNNTEWIVKPSAQSLLTAGFPNVIVIVLPKEKVKAAMQTAKQTLMAEWENVSQLVFDELKRRHWMPDLDKSHTTWLGWLTSQWQFYWTGLPIGTKDKKFKIDLESELDDWSTAQNQAYNLEDDKKLFTDTEKKLLQGHANIGSWWGYIFDTTRNTLASVKNARNWQLPTAFSPRSTISGIGSVVNPGKNGKDWMTEGDTKNHWSKGSLSDGTEQLNATETVKRGLPQILPELLKIDEKDITLSYPDLTSGVAGYLKVNGEEKEHKRNFDSVCREIINEFPKVKEILREVRGKWGIPWMDEQENPKQYHPRLLNAGWLLEDLNMEDLNSDPNLKNHTSQKIQEIINRHYPNNNPSNWYVLAAGDGDGMSKWLKGEKMKKYADYVPSELKVKSDDLKVELDNFLQIPKRMGPSTHSALSRALLDFSNRLVPYLTEKRYAGRLIYGGGDDVLAYTNLWEWDDWLWDIRQCFKGAEDPKNEFNKAGDYWEYVGKNQNIAELNLVARPMFTMGSQATISFGIVIAHHSVPLAIALESLWEAESEAKKHQCPTGEEKDAVQVRVLYSNGNTLKSTAKFQVFHQWQKLISDPELDSALFEQAASLWGEHPAPYNTAIKPWTKAFCARRDQLNDETKKNQFQENLEEFLTALFSTTNQKSEGEEKTNNSLKNPLDREVENWLKLAAFIKRSRKITLGGDI